jgi:hypothetical protein
MEIKCFVCGRNDTSAAYIKCVHEGQEKLVCVRCLPVLIHGGGH